MSVTTRQRPAARSKVHEERDRPAPRNGRVGWAWGALALGIASTVEGAGVSSGHAKAGMSGTMVTAIAVLAVGLVLLVWGFAVLTRAMRGWWRLLSVPAALTILVFVLFPITMAVNATSRPALPLGRETPAARGLVYRDVTFGTEDGVRLSAWYVPSRNGAAVVLLHGAGSTRSAVLEHGVVLAEHGYGVLLLDTRGHGLSEGRSMDFGWYGPLDIEAAVTFLERQHDVRSNGIAVVGLSMGGEQAIAALGTDPRIRAVVSEGATGMQTADHEWLARYGIRGSIQRGIDWVTYRAADLLSGASRPMSLRDAIRAAAPRPVLLIAGGSVPDEAYAGRFFQQASPSSVELWVVPGAGHTRGLATHPDEWERRVTAFLGRALETDTGGDEPT